MPLALAPRMQLERVIPLCLALTFPLVLNACADDSSSDEAADETGAGDGDGDPTTGDGDRDPTGDGDGDPTGDGDGDPSTGDGDGDPACPTANFPPLSPDPANAEYPDPYLNVSCVGDEIIVESNGIPAYEFVQLTPNPLSEQDYEWHIPLSPEVAADPTDIPLLGTIGIAVNGLPIYGPNERGMPDPYGDPVYNGIVDACFGHTAMAGDYHHHALLVACLTAATPDGEPDPIIAYSFDGFPVYGPMGCVDADCTDVVEYESGWVQTGDPSTYAWDNHEYQAGGATVLDPCNGHDAHGAGYHYHATSGFPYVLGCYAGTATGH